MTLNAYTVTFSFSQQRDLFDTSSFSTTSPIQDFPTLNRYHDCFKPCSHCSSSTQPIYPSQLMATCIFYCAISLRMATYPLLFLAARIAEGRNWICVEDTQVYVDSCLMYITYHVEAHPNLSLAIESVSHLRAVFGPVKRPVAVAEGKYSRSPRRRGFGQLQRENSSKLTCYTPMHRASCAFSPFHENGSIYCPLRFSMAWSSR